MKTKPKINLNKYYEKKGFVLFLYEDYTKEQHTKYYTNVPTSIHSIYKLMIKDVVRKLRQM